MKQFDKKLEALGERRPPPSGAAAGACAKTRFKLTFRLYRPERHQNVITSSSSKKYNFPSELLWIRSIKWHKMEILKYKCQNCTQV